MEFIHKKYQSFCNVLIHKGKILKDVIYRYCNMQGLSLTALAKKAGYDQSTPYRHFEKDDLPNHIILRWGKAMNYDFRKEFPELAMDWELIAPMEERGSSDSEQDTSLLEKIEYWRKKYVELLERHNELLMERLKNQEPPE
jgi:AcrR family transcriptional regulator